MDKRSQLYMEEYLGFLPKHIADRYSSFSSDHFCADELNANICADLVLTGEKRASCSLDYWYSYTGESRPKVGNLQVVTNWYGDPICIIELTSVCQCRFCDVTEEFAIAEGEGDKSLAWWRDAHWTFFKNECAELEVEPSEDMLLVLEYFKVVHR